MQAHGRGRPGVRGVPRRREVSVRTAIRGAGGGGSRSPRRRGGLKDNVITVPTSPCPLVPPEARRKRRHQVGSPAPSTEPSLPDRSSSPPQGQEGNRATTSPPRVRARTAGPAPPE